MTEKNQYPGQLVFGLDIGTRSIVGTVGYKEKEFFYVVAQRSKEHETRAMLDGQIHDIGRVGETIREVKEQLEEAVGRKLKDVCIAAAGRVLKTANVHVETVFEKEKEVLAEDIFALDSAGVEKAYEEFSKQEETGMRFYCVGYSVVRYYMNDYPIGNLESHKAGQIAADIIATFLPDDVVDGLYKSVEAAGLNVANLTLEPIAAIQVAIPEMYRMLNIALVDVGAGTSDISITREGSIVAYGMIPLAGDGLTELIAQACLVDFGTAEQIKRQACDRETIEYHDIMGLPQSITAEKVQEIVAPALTQMTKQVSDKIIELNADKPVSAVFVVGGGGKIPGYTDMLAQELGIQKERVALRGEEVMGRIEFLEENSKKDSLLVTPVGICLTFYLQSNNFIFVSFNGARIKLYDNTRLAVVDAAMQAGFPNDGLFPKRGRELNFTVNGKPRIIRGEAGEAAKITVNGEEADLYMPIKANDVITVKEATAGRAAKAELRQLAEYTSVLRVNVNGTPVELPKFFSVDGRLESGYYEIQSNDRIDSMQYYTVGQLLQFMDVSVVRDSIYVNRMRANSDTRVYENFSVEWRLTDGTAQESGETLDPDDTDAHGAAYADIDGAAGADAYDTGSAEDYGAEDADPYGKTEGDDDAQEHTQHRRPPEKAAEPEPSITLHVTVNGRPITLQGKPAYVYVDIFDVYPFDLSTPQGKRVVTLLNGRPAQYLESLHEGDMVELYWQD